jgi:hypothetical protein
MSDPFPVGARVVDRSDPATHGVVLESPAVDPEGNIWACHVVVEWDDNSIEVVPTANLRIVEKGGSE